MDKLKMHSPNGVDANISRIRELFPNCVTEAQDEHGRTQWAVDFDLLRQELSASIVEGPQERYQLNWPGKREALLAANAPIAKTLRPCREESVNFDTTQNLFIEGDNLEALKLLQETYLGKIKLIYIDPPYNTGKDFIYDDDFSQDANDYLLETGQINAAGTRMQANTEANGRFHSDWLSMMYPRLRLARTLMTEDALIFVSIDDREVSSLRSCMDEIFGRTNFVAQISWEKRYTRSNNSKKFYSLKDNIIVFQRSEMLTEIKEKRTKKADLNYKNPDNDARGPWTTSSYVNPATKESRPNLSYEITNPFTKKKVSHPTHAWKFSKEEHEKHVLENRLYWGKSGQSDYPRLKIFLTEQSEGMVPVDIWDYKSVGTTDEAGSEIKALFGSMVFDTPKPTKLIMKMMDIATTGENEEIVLDFFAGSCSTAEALLKKNNEDGGKRRFIVVQVNEPTNSSPTVTKTQFSNISDIGKERIRRAGQSIISDQRSAISDQRSAISDQRSAISDQRSDPTPNGSYSGQRTEPLDIGFRVLKIDSSNMADVYYTPDEAVQGVLAGLVDNVKPDRTAEDLLFQVMLDWGVDLGLPITRQHIQDKEVFFVDGNALAACFDKDGGIDEAFCKELATYQPLRVVFRDAGFAGSDTKISVEEIFRVLSPGTEVKHI